MKPLLALAAILSLGLPASAGTITFNGVDTDRGRNIWFNADGRDRYVFSGAYDITVNGEIDVLAMCVEFFKTISTGTYDSVLDAPSTINLGNRIAWLIERNLQFIDSRDKGAGLQLALWDLVHDSGDGFAAGRIRRSSSYTTNAAVLGFANDFITSSIGQSSNSAVIYWNTNQGDGKMRQTLISGVPNPGGEEVPEPATVLLMGSALLGCAWMRRRRG